MDTDSFQFLIEIINQINWPIIGSVGLIIFLLILSALISGSEVAFFSLKWSDLDENSKNNQIRRVKELLLNPQKLLATILVSNNFVNILIILLLAGVGEFFFKGIEIYIIRFLIEVIFITFLILLFGEVIPKIFASRNALKFASFMSIPMQPLIFLLSPLTYPMINLTAVIEKKLAKKKGYLSVEKLSRALELTSENATTEEEQKILEGIINFGNTDTNQVMKPRMDIVAFSGVVGVVCCGTDLFRTALR